MRSTPFMTYYSLYTHGMYEQALSCIKSYWGAIADAGFDCCPECFQPGNDRLSPYGAEQRLPRLELHTGILDPPISYP